MILESKSQTLRRARIKAHAPALHRRRLTALGAVSLACLLSVCAAAQQPPHVKNTQPTPPDVPSARGSEDSEQISRTEEMLKDAEIRRDEALYKETVGRAKETAQLAAEVRDAYRLQKSLGAEELKKLGRIEKLARSIRNEMGGGEGDDAMKDPPAQIGDALDRLAEMSDDLRKRVEKTPRHVVSAAVITAANQLIELTKRIRTGG